MSERAYWKALDIDPIKVCLALIMAYVRDDFNQPSGSVLHTDLRWKTTVSTCRNTAPSPLFWQNPERGGAVNFFQYNRRAP